MKKLLALLLSICILAGTAPLSMAAGSSSSAPASSDYVANEVLIMQDTSAAVPEPLPFESAKEIDTSALYEENVRTLVGTVAYGTDIEQLCEQLRLRDDILSADPNYLQTIDSITVPAEATRSGSDYNAFNWYRDNLQLTQAWQGADTLGDASITVAVLDTGVNINHKEFEGAIWEDAEGCKGYNAIDGSDDVTDNNGHGSNVAGIIAMRSNAFGYVGIAPAVKIMAIKVAKTVTMTDEAILNGLNYAIDNGADIINMSFGSATLSSAMGMAYQRAARKAVLIAAAGNNMADAEVTPQFPAACNGVLGVMSYGDYSHEARSHYTIDNGELSSFSNYDRSGRFYQISAPGVEIAGPANDSNTAFKFKSGTSQAAPIVAGTAALYMSLHPQATPYQVKQALLNGSQKTVTGYTDSARYKALDIAGTLAEDLCEDRVVPLSEGARHILDTCFSEPLETVHQSDLEALCIISRTFVTDIADYVTAIPELYTVQYLTLDGVDVQAADAAVLESATLPNLFLLDISRNEHIGGFAFSPGSAPALRELYADSCKLGTTDTLENLPALKTLSLSDNTFETSYRFEKLSGLEELAVDGCRLQDVRAFADFEQLQYLDASDNYITDISPLTYYGGTYLNVQENPLALGVRQDYYVRTIEAFMKENVASTDQIRFYYSKSNADDGKQYTKAEQLSFPTVEYPRSAQAATLQTALSPADANVNSYSRFFCDNEKVRVDSLSGTIRWNAEDFGKSEDLTVRYSPVAAFPAAEGSVRIAAPQIHCFTYEDGGFTLLTNAATEFVMIGSVRLSERHRLGDEWSFAVPAAVAYDADLRATAYDAYGAGDTATIGTQPQAQSEQAQILSATSDKEEYFTGETATLEIAANTAANFIKVYDCTYATATVVSAYTLQRDSRIFTLRVPLTAARDYRFKCYASATEHFSAGATVVRFSVLQKAKSLQLTCAEDAALYLSEGNDTLQLESSLVPANAPQEAVSFRSLDARIATVDTGGKVTAQNYGQTAIVATTASGLSASFPVIVSAPRMNEPDVSEDYVGEASCIDFYSRGASGFVLKNADGSDCTVDYSYEAYSSDIAGYDTNWVIALYPQSAAPLNLKLYAVDDNGLSEESNFKLIHIEPILPVQSFQFEQSAYSFERSGGAVKISLDVVPAASTEFFNWSISTNTVATMKAYSNYCILTPKKTGSVTLTASTMIGGRESSQSVLVSFTEGRIYAASADVSAVDLYEELTIEVTTDQSVSYLDIEDSNTLSIEYSDYMYYEDRGGYRYWTLPYFFKRDAAYFTVRGGDSVGNLSGSIQVPVSAAMPEKDFAANPTVVMGTAGKILPFNLISLPSRANIPFNQYTAVSADESIARYDIGNVYLYAEGETTLHCTYGGQTTDVRVIVSAPIQSIEPREEIISLFEGESYVLDAAVTPPSSENIRYESSDSAVATVSPAGVVSAVSVGTATITLTAENGVSAAVTVRVKAADEITALSFDQTAYTLEIPHTLDYTLLANTDITNKISYYSSNTDLLSVSADGCFTALKEGVVTITAVSDSGVQASALVHLSAERRLALSRPQIDTTVKSTVYLSALLSPSTADLDGYWVSDTPAVAVVNQSGTVYTKTPGTCRIYYVSTRGEIVSCLVKVSDIPLSKITFPESEITLAVNQNYIVPYSKSTSYSAEIPLWHSEQDAIAAVDENGIIYGVSEGTTTIIATIGSGRSYPLTVHVTAPALCLSGESAQSATLESRNILGTVQSYAVDGSFTIEPFAGGSYTFTLRALHHTSLTITDAQVFSSADLGTLQLQNGDANADGVIDLADISLLLATANYGKPVDTSRRGMDIDDNGIININDINVILLAENYGGRDRTIEY